MIQMSRARPFLPAGCAFLLAASTVGPSVGEVRARPVLPDAPAVVDASVLGRTTAGPIVASGRLLDAGGRPSPGTVALVAWPNDASNRAAGVGATVLTPTVGWAAAGSDGSFSLRLDPTLVTADYVNADGRVNLEAIGWASNHQ